MILWDEKRVPRNIHNMAKMTIFEVILDYPNRLLLLWSEASSSERGLG
jgi:hypothetical protein